MYKTKQDLERVISLGKNQDVITVFAESYLQGVEYDKWSEANKVTHSELFPKQLPNPDYVVDSEEPVSEFIDNEEYIDFDTWMAETKITTEEVAPTYDEDGMELTPYVAEVTELVRVYEPIEVDVTGWKVDNYKILRQHNYPPMADYLDAIVKSDMEAQEAYINNCLEVKAMFPK